MEIAPILLFSYKRVTPLQETVKALQNNFLAGDSELYIFSDGPKNEQEVESVNQIRAYLKTITGFKKVVINESEENKGLSNSIIDGVSSIINITGRVIVLEDDLLTTPNFLNYMNAGLNQYKHDKQIFSICGYSFDLGVDPNDKHTDAYFINRGWPWGWASWADRWNQVDWEMKEYQDFKKDRALQREFAKCGSDANKMLENHMNNGLDAWDICWVFNQFKLKGLSLYPKYSKVYNNGFDEFATHTKGSFNRYIPVLDTMHNRSFNFPKTITIHPFYQRRFRNKLGYIARIKSKIETLITHCFKIFKNDVKK